MVRISNSEAGTGSTIPPITAHYAELVNLCKQFQVRQLELFGSAANGSFDAESSDLDFLIEFEPLPSGSYATAFFGFKEALENLFGRSVDLVVHSAIRNPYFRQSVEKSKALLYAA